MLGLNRIVRIAIVALVAAVSASVASSATATAKPDPQDYPNTNRVQTKNNGAGVIFHPFGDKFEIWDNVKDGQPIAIYWNYVGIDDEWKWFLCKRRYCVISRNFKEEPHQIYFFISSTPGSSQTVRYRTWGA